MAPRPSTNAELVQKYRDKSRALSSGRRPSAADKLLRLVLQLLVLTICKGVQTLSVPVGKLFAVYFWLGKNVVTLSLFLEKQLLKAVGWLSGTGFGRDSRLGRLSNHYWGVDLKRWHVGLVALVLGGVVHGVVRTIRNSFDERVKRARWLRRLMTAASTYDEWRAHAARLEQLEGADMRGAVEHEDYDRKLLLEKLRHLKRMRATGNPREQMLALRIDLIRNVANIAKSQAHRQNFVSVPQPIQQYIGEVKGQLELLAAWPEAELPLEEKLSFFRVTRHAYGRTALLLSGGGGLGTFHLGVCKALFEHNLLPRVLAGSSVGSIVCALVGTRTDEELRRTFANLDKFDVGFFQNSTALDLMRYAMNKGHLQDISFMICKLRQLLGDCTFLEAFERTGRILNVTVCPADTNEPPRLLNYMTAPQALVWSAVAASSSFPGLYPPQHLLGRNSHGETIKLHGHGGSDALQRRWRDGSLEFDLPVQTLAEMFNCNHFLVSQTNPHIVPLLNFKAIFPRKWASIMEAELKHRLQVVQWMLPEWQLSKWLTLFTQPWEGDITFTLPSMLWNLRKTIVNPSTLELMHAVQVGEHATWERMASIECNCSIEATLDMCAAKLQHRARGTSMPAIGGKVPSWLHMPQPLYTSGMPPSGRSWGDGIADNEACAAVASWGDFSSMLNGNSSRVHLPPLHRPPLYFSLHQPAFELPEGSEADALEAETTGTSHAADDPKQQQAHHRLSLAGRSPHLPPIPIPSSLSSEHEHDHEQDGFDSASSVAAASGGAGTLLQRALSHSRRGAAAAVAGATEGLQSAGSTGISRRSSMMRHLNLMAGPEHEEGLASKGSLLAASTGLPMGAVGGSGSPVPGSNRSSISLPEVQQQVPALPPQQQQQHGPQQGGWVGSFGSPTASTPAATAGSEGLPPRAPPKESLPRHASAPAVHHQVASRPLHGPVSAAGAVSAGASPVKPIMQPPPAASTSAMPAHAGGAGAGAGQPCPGVMASTITEQQLLELANMDTGGMIDDIWGSLLPLAGTCVSLTSANGQQGGPAGSATGQAGGLGTVSEDSDAIDIFAY